MTALSIQPTFPTFTGADGQPLENGYIWVGTANLNPITNPIAVYWDAALSAPATQPIRTLGGYPSNSGTPSRLYVNSDYSIQVLDRKGSMVYSAPVATERYGGGIINANIVVYDPSGTGAVATTVQARLRTTRYATEYDTLANFFDAASGYDNFLPGQTYTLTSLLSMPALSNCTIRGVPGVTKITGAFGYGLILLDALDDVVFQDIIFETTYTNATISSNTGVVYSGNTNISRTHFERCKFTAPNANTQGLAIFNRTNSGGSDTCTVDGLYIEYCEFSSIGQSACTVYNRQISSDKYSAMRNIYFRNNTIKDIGLNNNFGIGISLDGYGSSFWIDNNYFNNCYLIGIENTGYTDGSISFNTFDNDTRGYGPVRVADSTATYPVSNVIVVGNKCVGNNARMSYISFANNCHFYGNVWSYSNALVLSANATAAFSFLDSNNCTVNGDWYSSDTGYALLFQNTTGATAGNRVKDVVTGNYGAATNIATIAFDGSGTTNNIVYGKLVKGTGGSSWAQTNGAANNTYGNDAIGTGSLSLTFVTPGDLSFVGTAPYRYTRVGRLCTVTWELDSTTFTHTTAAGALRLTGLPFTVLHTTVSSNYGSLGAFRGITKANYTQYTPRAVGGQTYLQLYTSGSGQVPATVSASDMPTGGTVLLYGSVTYEVAD